MNRIGKDDKNRIRTHKFPFTGSYSDNHPMTKFRTLVFLYLISFAGLLWAVFLSWLAGYFLEGAMMAGLILVTNVIVLISYFRR